MRGRYELVEDDNPYGPGADLVLSLFAMAILMVGLIGTGDAVQRGAGMAETPVRSLPAGPDPRDGRLRAVEDEAAFLRGVVERRKALLRERDSVRIDLTEVTAEDGPLFETCGGNALAQYSCQLRPTPRLNAALIMGLRAKAADMRSVGTNQIVVEVRGLATPFESPVSRQREGQLDLSVDRAAGIAHMLAARGLPYACIVPIGLGRTRSPSLARQIDRGQEALDRWDKVTANQVNAKIFDRLDDLRVTAYARKDDIDDVCPTDILSRAIAKIRD